MKKKSLPKNVKLEPDNLHHIDDAGHMDKDELLMLIPKCEAGIETLRSLAATARFATMAEVQEEFKHQIAEREADMAAILRVAKMIEESTKSSAANKLPKPVGELMRQFLATHAEPFTVKQAAEWLERIQPGVTSSAVAQAVGRLGKHIVKVAQKGVGPNPTYFQRVEGSQNTISSASRSTLRLAHRAGTGYAPATSSGRT